ncbi:MAG: YibE/F family protein [Cyanobacteriota bacterium]
MRFVFSLIFTLLILLFSNLNLLAEDNISDNYIEEVGQVINIINDNQDKSLDVFGEGHTIQTVKVKVLSGELEGKEFTTENILSGNPAYDIPVKKGDKVVLDIEEDTNGVLIANISNLYRTHALTILVCVFALLILIFGGLKGLKAIICLVLTYLMIFYFLIPGLLKGYNPLFLTVIICFLATCVTIFIISGINMKSLSAVIGTIGGVVAAAIVSLFTIKVATLSGIPNHEAVGLWTEFPDLDFKGILASAMIIGALGAAMDVAISVASCIMEVKQVSPEISIKDLIKSGMNVGKDIMGTMTNTLLLAYTGSAMFLLLLVNNNVSLIKLLNLDSIVSEITAALAGSIGLVLCIPITAVIGSYLINKTKITKVES